jgi:transcription elongation GreA/GreB family factor
MKEDLKIKESLYKACLKFIETKFQVIQNTINEIQEALVSDTKSSAGDKHETGRAMLQIEREKAGNQLAEIQKSKNVLDKIDITKTSETVRLGSVVYTSKSNYFIAISVGEFIIEGIPFYAISPNTPIGQLLISKCVGETINFRNKVVQIEKVI